jgi:hypothetical protein
MQKDLRSKIVDVVSDDEDDDLVDYRQFTTDEIIDHSPLELRRLMAARRQNVPVTDSKCT